MFRFLKNWLRGQNPKQSAPGTRATFRPSLEALEERAVPTTWLGNYTASGMFYPAGNQRVDFFVAEVQGSFTYANAEQAWQTGAHIADNYVQTLKTNGTVADHTSSQHFLLIGWENVDTHMGGWLAARNDGNYAQIDKSGPWWNPTYSTSYHASMDWMSNDGQSGHVLTGWFTMNYKTNNSDLSLTVGANPNGDIDATFTPPHVTPV